jgi:phage gpG-like protein
MASDSSKALKNLTRDIEKKLDKLSKLEFETKGKVNLPTLELDIDLDGIKTLGRELEQTTDTFVQFISQDIAVKLDASIDKFGVVDTGALKNSLIVDTSNNTVTFSYDSPYAAIQHYGGYILPYGNRSAQPVYLKPRPWLDAVLDTYDFEQVFDSLSNF